MALGSLGRRSGNEVNCEAARLLLVREQTDEPVMSQAHVAAREHYHACGACRQVLATQWKLARRIRQEGMKVETGVNGTLTVVGAGDDVSANIWDWARQCGVGVQSLIPAKNSLEQIFIEAVQEDQSAPA